VCAAAPSFNLRVAALARRQQSKTFAQGANEIYCQERGNISAICCREKSNLRFQVYQRAKSFLLFAFCFLHRIAQSEVEKQRGNALAGSCGVEWIYLQLEREAYFEMFATDNHNNREHKRQKLRK
jgi:hypothetical protein